jgi:TolA-binding protein
MSRRTLAAGAGAFASVVVAVAAYVVVGGLPGLLYAGAVLMAGLFAAVKFGLVPDSREGRWQRKSVLIAELRTEVEERDGLVAELRDQLEREAEEARRAQDAHEARIRELENERTALQALVDDERGRLEQFLGELTGGIGQRGDELAALERELTTLAGG